jgi:hypothetical protein
MRTEEEDQIALIEWFDWWATPDLKGRLFAVPNGGLRNKVVAAKLKRQGVRTGVPDLMLLTPRHGFAGLVIEMKREVGGRMTADQADWLDWLAQQNYMTVVCKGFQPAVDTVVDYLKVQNYEA